MRCLHEAIVAAIGCMFLYTMRSSQRPIAATRDRSPRSIAVTSMQHVCLHGTIVAAIGRATDRSDDRTV